MVAYNFKKQFAEDVESGHKRQTIRSGEPRCKAGDDLQLYTGQRTKACRKLRDEVCVQVRAIRISSFGQIELAGQILDSYEMDELARADGFVFSADMLDWFRSSMPIGETFNGHVVNW